MSSPYQEPFDECEQALTSKPRKIDPMGMLGKIFASVGATMVVIGVLIACILGWTNPGGFGFFFFFAILAGEWGTGLVFVLMGLAQLLFFRNIKSANVVNNYLMALVNQDYKTAFQYLDLGITTLQEQTWFTQWAQTYDERGKISDYSLKGFRLNQWSTMYTIRIRRGERSYIIHLSLLKRGDTWKIVGSGLF